MPSEYTLTEDVERSFKNIINWMNNQQRRKGYNYKNAIAKVKENMEKLLEEDRR